jgi:hypothetical protein
VTNAACARIQLIGRQVDDFEFDEALAILADFRVERK